MITTSDDLRKAIEDGWVLQDSDDLFERYELVLAGGVARQQVSIPAAAYMLASGELNPEPWVGLLRRYHLASPPSPAGTDEKGTP